MQVPNALIAVAAEASLALAVATTLLFIHARKLKSLVRRQQEKLLELLKNPTPTPATAIAPPPQAPTQSYKNYLNLELDATSRQFSSISDNGDITQEQPIDRPLLLQVLALRYAFLRAEELGTTEETGTSEYWSIFEQTLSPLLKQAQGAKEQDPELAAELETARKRIENLEKFKRLFFDMEKQWNEAKIKANDYYMQLIALSDTVGDRESFTSVLESYNNVYDNINQQFIELSQPQPGKTIHITRQDPRAADEIIKLRNVAADQHRIINQLQRKLIEAKTAEDKELVIQELQQQLQRQTRFVQESETCVQLLEDELTKVHQELSNMEKELGVSQTLSDENLRMKTTLQSFTLESKDLMQNIDSLEKENSLLKQNQDQSSPAQPQAGDTDFKKVQTEYLQLQQQYAELEEKYLELKLGS